MTSSRHHQDSKPNNFRVVWGPQRFYLSIGWKTLIAFAMVVFIPMLGLMALTDHTLRRAMEEETLRSMEANLRGAWRVYYERSNTLRSALMQSANTPETVQTVKSGNARALAELLSRNAAQLPFTDVWLVIDSQSQIIARRQGSSGGPLLLNNIVSRAFASLEPVASTELLSNELFLAENPLKFSSLSPHVMSQVVVVPIVEDGKLYGGFVGLILMNGDEWLPNAIHDYLSIDAAVFGSVIQESRIISASTHPNNIWASGLLSPASLSETIERGETYRGSLLINEIPSYVIADPIKNIEGHPIGALSVGVRGSNIDALISNNTRNIYLFIGVGILLSLLIAYLAYRDTMTPMRALIGAMTRFANGDLTTRTDIRTKDEFDDLGDRFNHMAQSIQEHQERVESFNSLSSLLIASLNPQSLMQNVLDKIIELTRAQAGTIYLREGEGNNELLVPFVAYGVDLAAMEYLHFGQGLPGEAARRKKSIVIRDIPTDCRLNINLGIADVMPREVAIFPIIYRDSVLGVMMLASMSPFHSNELSQLESMINQIAIVLENALAHEKVAQLSITDTLTGVYNRRYLTQRLEEEFRISQRHHSPLSALLVDIDYFKKINDQYGHQIGDEALIRVAHTLKDNIRDSDLLARFGGEEFVIILPHTLQTDAMLVAEKLRQAISSLIIAAMGDHRVTISIGVATIPDVTIDNSDGLLGAADRALYLAKEQGRNRVIFAIS
ncbi:MAG TPA: diguanylate cyclase [Gammaproteobacteria bacterium]